MRLVKGWRQHDGLPVVMFGALAMDQRHTGHLVPHGTVMVLCSQIGQLDVEGLG
jgi:hypothetical protein